MAIRSFARKSLLQTRTYARIHTDDRIKTLELEVRRLAETLNVFRDEVHMISKTLYTKVRSRKKARILSLTNQSCGI